MDDRISREAMFLQIAKTVGKRSTCPRASVGALITNSGRIIGMGYNGAPPGMDHCIEVGCESENVKALGPGRDVTIGGCDRTVHAEANAIAFAAQDGVEIGGSTMYCTHAPCYTCAKLMISAGIRVFHYITPYRDPRGANLLLSTNMRVFDHAS